MCIGYISPHWSVLLLQALIISVILAGMAFLVSVRFIGRRRAGWVALTVGIVGSVVVSFILVMFTGYLGC